MTEKQRMARHNNGIRNIKFMCPNISEQNKGRRWLTNDKENRFVKDKNLIKDLLSQGYRFGYNSSLRGGGHNV